MVVVQLTCVTGELLPKIRAVGDRAAVAWGVEMFIIDPLTAAHSLADCCDGSDEPAGKCPNTCYEKGHEALSGLREQVGASPARTKRTRGGAGGA